jgi:hypothetical protein
LKILIFWSGHKNPKLTIYLIFSPLNQTKKILRATEKLLNARREREEWLAEVKIKRQERLAKKYEKAAQNSAHSSRSVSPHAEGKPKDGAEVDSTDEDDIDAKIHILYKPRD